MGLLKTGQLKSGGIVMDILKITIENRAANSPLYSIDQYSDDSYINQFAFYFNSIDEAKVALRGFENEGYKVDYSPTFRLPKPTTPKGVGLGDNIYLADNGKVIRKAPIGGGRFAIKKIGKVTNGVFTVTNTTSYRIQAAEALIKRNLATSVNDPWAKKIDG